MTEASEPAGRRSRLWPTLVAVTVSVVLLGWSLRGVDLAEFLASLRSARVAPILAAVLLATSLFPLRVFRWRLLLRHADGTGLSWPAMWHPIAMGFMANNVLPFRVGEVVRVFAASRLGDVSFGAALSSVAVERIFDGLALIGLLSVALFWAGISGDVSLGGVSLAQAATLGGILSGGALVGAILVVSFPRPAERLVRVVVPSAKWSTRIIGLLEDLRHGLQALKSPGRVLGVVVWSVVLWLINGLSFYVAFKAFDIPVGLAGALLMQGVLALGISVPSAPGYVGVFEAAIKLVLVSLYGVSNEVALAYALTYHFTTFIPITLLGLWSVARTGLGLGGLRRAAASHGP